MKGKISAPSGLGCETDGQIMLKMMMLLKSTPKFKCNKESSMNLFQNVFWLNRDPALEKEPIICPVVFWKLSFWKLNSICLKICVLAGFLLRNVTASKDGQLWDSE